MQAPPNLNLNPVIKDEPGGTEPGPVTPTQKLREKLSAFRFNDELVPSLPRSTRSRTSFKREEFEEVDSALPKHPLEPPSRSKKRRQTHEEQPPVNAKPSPGSVTSSDSRSGTPKRARISTPAARKRAKIEIATPDKYAHLNSLSDHLGERPDVLDVMFCGINPGQTSALTGHHFTHRSNHFWRCLHGGQLTDKLLSPDEDGTLPERFNLGLTNLVERPSAQAAEIPTAEFAAGAPALLRKIARYRPRVVCFVGKGIWDAFVRAAATTDTSPRAHTEFTMRVGMEGGGSDSGPDRVQVAGESAQRIGDSSSGRRGNAKVSKKAGKQKQVDPFVYDLQPYKMVHQLAKAIVRETLFFVVVSTSGLVASHQLPDKIEQFARLKRRVDELKAGKVDTASMAVIPAPPPD